MITREDIDIFLPTNHIIYCDLWYNMHVRLNLTTRRNENCVSQRRTEARFSYLTVARALF